MKRFLVVPSVLALSLLPCLASAGDGNCFNGFDGFYAGAGAGGVISTAAISSRSGLFETPNSNYTSLIPGETTHTYDNSAIGAIHFGYGKAWERFFLGAEAFADVANRQVSQDGYYEGFREVTRVAVAVHNTVSTDNGEFGFDLKPGYVLKDDLLLYARIGVAFNRLNLESQVSGSASSTEPLPPLEPLGTYSTSKNVTALRLGIGMEHKLNKNLGLTADYIYTDYGNISLSGYGESQRLEVQSNVNASLRTHAALIGLVYHFA